MDLEKKFKRNILSFIISASKSKKLLSAVDHFERSFTLDEVSVNQHPKLTPCQRRKLTPL